MLSQANLALQAYAEVVGADGSSPSMNSGVTTARSAVGTYTVTLPTGQYQSSTRDIIQVQIKGATPLFYAADADDADPSIKRIFIGSSATTAVDADFSILIWRSLLSPPPGAPA